VIHGLRQPCRQAKEGEMGAVASLSTDSPRSYSKGKSSRSATEHSRGDGRRSNLSAAEAASRTILARESLSGPWPHEKAPWAAVIAAGSWDFGSVWFTSGHRRRPSRVAR
jgi:hypothetical protein